MKKIFLLLSFISVLSFADKNVVEFRGGYDIYNHVKDKDFDNSDDLFKNGWNLGLEYRKEVMTGLELGAGIEINQSSSKTPNDLNYPGGISIKYDYDNLTSVPLYFTARYKFENPSEFTPYVKLNLGYSINSSKLERHDHEPNFYILGAKHEVKNSFYYGFGAGVEYKKFLVDLTYEINDFKVDGEHFVSKDLITGVTTYKDENYKFKNHKLKLSLGYQLDF